MTIYDVHVQTIDGDDTSLGAYEGKAVLIVNVASKCGLTPQYTGLEELQKVYGPDQFTVLGFPCNQFGGQEPGTTEEIKEFCSMTYGVSFPLFDKIDVNGPARHPLYDLLTQTPDTTGKAGDVAWNFEKFLISPTGDILGRFRPEVTPEDPALVAAIEAALPA